MYRRTGIRRCYDSMADARGAPDSEHSGRKSNETDGFDSPPPFKRPMLELPSEERSPSETQLQRLSHDVFAEIGSYLSANDVQRLCMTENDISSKNCTALMHRLKVMMANMRHLWFDTELRQRFIWDGPSARAILCHYPNINTLSYESVHLHRQVMNGGVQLPTSITRLSAVCSDNYFFFTDGGSDDAKAETLMGASTRLQHLHLGCGAIMPIVSIRQRFPQLVSLHMPIIALRLQWTKHYFNHDFNQFPNLTHLGFYLPGPTDPMYDDPMAYFANMKFPPGLTSLVAVAQTHNTGTTTFGGCVETASDDEDWLNFKSRLPLQSLHRIVLPFVLFLEAVDTYFGQEPSLLNVVGGLFHEWARASPSLPWRHNYTDMHNNEPLHSMPRYLLMSDTWDPSLVTQSTHLAVAVDYYNEHRDVGRRMLSKSAFTFHDFERVDYQWIGAMHAILQDMQLIEQSISCHWIAILFRHLRGIVTYIDLNKFKSHVDRLLCDTSPYTVTMKRRFATAIALFFSSPFLHYPYKRDIHALLFKYGFGTERKTILAYLSHHQRNYALCKVGSFRSRFCRVISTQDANQLLDQLYDGSIVVPPHFRFRPDMIDNYGLYDD